MVKEKANDLGGADRAPGWRGHCSRQCSPSALRPTDSGEPLRLRPLWDDGHFDANLPRRHRLHSDQLFFSFTSRTAVSAGLNLNNFRTDSA